MENTIPLSAARRPRILVAEDEPAIALGLEDALRFEGYEVEVVTNGENASRHALEQSFDLILLDMMLPGKDGFDICRELRCSGLQTPIIFLTARTVEADRVAGDYPTPFILESSLSISPDDRRFIVHALRERGRWTGDYWVLENFLPAAPGIPAARNKAGK